MSRTDQKHCVVYRSLSGVEELLERVEVIFVSVPGMGETATIYAAAKQLKRMAESGVSQASSLFSHMIFTHVFRHQSALYVKINGHCIQEPSNW